MSKEAMKLALEALKQIDEAMPFPVAKLAQAALREALAEQPARQQEPVACANGCRGFVKYPAQRTWVGLTEQEAAECWSTSTVRTWQAIEAKLKEKNA